MSLARNSSQVFGVANLPGIIEVPGLDGEGPDAANMDALRSLLR